MSRVSFEGRQYDASYSFSPDLLSAVGLYTFRYFPKEKIIINDERTISAYRCRRIYSNMPDSFIEEFVDERYADAYAKAYEEIDKGAKKASVTFYMKDSDSICKVTLAPSDYDTDGNLEVAVGVVENVTDVILREKEHKKNIENLNAKLKKSLNLQRETNEELAQVNEELRASVENEQAINEELMAMLEIEKEHTAIIGALSSIYFAIYQLDFVDGTFREMFSKKSIREILGDEGDAATALSQMAEKLILPPTQAVMRAFNEFSSMAQRIQDQKIISQEYVGVTTGWSRACIIPTERDSEGNVVKALYCTRTIDSEKEKLDAQSNLINALASTYQDVYVVDMDTGDSTAYRMSSKTAIDNLKLFAKGSYEKNLDIYIKNSVHISDGKLFDPLRTIEQAEKTFEETDNLSFTYRELINDHSVYFQCQAIKPTVERREFIIALKNIDKEIREGIENTRMIDEQLKLIQALSDKYSSLFIVNTTDGSIVPYRLHPKNQRDYGESIKNGLTWDELILDYSARFTYADYIEEIKEKACIKNIVKEIEEKQAFLYEYKNDRAGEKRFYRIKAVPISGRDPLHIIIGIADVNDERESQLTIQKALQDAYDSARAANHAKSDFLANMSHDIRTPMNAIIGMTAIAATRIDDKEKVQDCLKKITVASKHLLSLINEVLDMSKIESGKIDMIEEEFNLSDLIDNLLTMARPQIEAHKHEIVINITGVEHEKVIGDSLHLQQVFVNLLSNAIKYTPDGGKITVSLKEKPTNKNFVGCYEAVFEDNGIGMTKEFVKKIFEPFSRAEDERVGKVQGTGLGMAISANIINMMGGNIKVDSEPDKGTKFTVNFFLKLQQEDEAHYEDFINLPVLVADDDEISVESVCSMLDELGMKADGVLSGEEAVEKVEEKHKIAEDYFAIILDWQMPGMDGLTSAREIRKRVGDDITIIIISAYDWSDIEKEAREAGVNAFIAKPLFKSRLTHLFNTLVGKENDVQEDIPLKNFEELDLSGHRLLLVEDNELNAEIATEILKMTGIEVDVADDGTVAVEILSREASPRYDMILMDIQMPKMNGYEATRAIRSMEGNYYKTVPIVAMTANAFADDVQEALICGMNGHIAKPIDLKELTGVLNRWLVHNNYVI